MNRILFVITGLVGGALAAGVGWHLGRPKPASGASTPPIPRPAAAVSTPDAAYLAAAAPDYDARRGRSLQAILDGIDAARLDPVTQATVDTGLSSELFALLESLTAEEIPLVLEHLNALPPPSPDRLLATVLGLWARQDGAAAMAWAARLTPARLDVMRGPILAGWAHHDPASAWTWYRQAWSTTPEPRYKLEQDFPKLIHAWARHDVPGAFNACLEAGRHGTYDKWSGLTSLVALPDRREEIMGLISGIADEKQRGAARSSALGQWAASAPGEAAAWLDAELPDADSNLVWSIAERFGRANPRANADWLLNRTAPDQRDEAYRLCLHQWAEHAPDEAAAWLESAGPTDMSAEIFASRFARTDLDKAMMWARRVSPEKRPEALVNTLAHALLAGQKPDVAAYATEAGISAENLTKKVEAARQQIGSRL
jgi:hypothetical protein